MNAENTLQLEVTDLGKDCSGLFQAWICGRASARTLAVSVHERLSSSSRMRDLNADRRDSFDKLDLLTGGAVLNAAQSKTVYDEFFREGPEVLFLKAKSVLVGIGVFSGISNISISQVNSTFRRLCLEARWTDSTMESADSRKSPSLQLYHLHIYMEIIRAYMELYKSPGRHQSTPTSPLSLFASTIRSEFSISHEPDNTTDIESVLSINSTIDVYLIKLMKLKTSSLKLLSVHQRDRLYAFLGVSPDSSDAVLKRAYRQKAMELHPDKGGSKEMFQELNEIYETILQERGISGVPMVPEDDPSPPVSAPADPPSPPPHLEKENTDKESLAKLLKAAHACISSAKKATEMASNFVENPDSTELTNFIKYVREVGYACLDASCVVNEPLKQTISTAGFELLNSVNEIPETGETVSKMSMTVTIGEVTKKCVSCAQFMSRMTQDFEEKNSPLKPAVKISREDDRLANAKRQRMENAQLLRKIDDDLRQQQIQLVHMVDDEELDKSRDVIEWYKLVLSDHIQECLAEVRDWLRGRSEGSGIVEEFCSRCQLFDQLSIPATAVGRACRLVYITNPEYVKRNVFDQVAPGLVKLGLRSLTEEEARDMLIFALGRVEALHLSKVPSYRSSTRSSPIVRPIELGIPEQIHRSQNVIV